ncbi:hypothetical protein FF38_00952 [Lucilia cuprina]|uniref:Uncharacterized protein n=1 Tax=Lucilia cuprina TaxID=7375 RepID=A0A0L0BZP1_LUCCU|nr:hypothetical protein FF38_00952 [Lucilia cuprina]
MEFSHPYFKVSPRCVKRFCVCQINNIEVPFPKSILDLALSSDILLIVIRLSEVPSPHCKSARVPSPPMMNVRSFFFKMYFIYMGGAANLFPKIFTYILMILTTFTIASILSKYISTWMQQLPVCVQSSLCWIAEPDRFWDAGRVMGHRHMLGNCQIRFYLDTLSIKRKS